MTATDVWSDLPNESTKYPRVRKWMLTELRRGVPPLSIWMGLHLASTADDFRWLCRQNLSQLPGAPAGRLLNWYGLWRSSRTMWLEFIRVTLPAMFPLLELLYQWSDDPKDLKEDLKSGSLELAGWLADATREQRSALGQCLAWLSGRLVWQLFVDLDLILDATDLNEREPPRGEAFDTLLFFVRIWLPAHAHYHKPPETLYNEALAGNLGSLKAVLSLDPSMMHEPELHDHIFVKQRGRKRLPIGNNAPSPIKRLKRCQSAAKAVLILWGVEYSKIVAKIGQKPVIEFLRKAFGVEMTRSQPLTIPSFQRLFDALHSDRHGQLANDPDLHDDGDALRQAVNRLKRFLPLTVCDSLYGRGVTV